MNNIILFLAPILFITIASIVLYKYGRQRPQATCPDPNLVRTYTKLEVSLLEGRCHCCGHNGLVSDRFSRNSSTMHCPECGFGVMGHYRDGVLIKARILDQQAGSKSFSKQATSRPVVGQAP